MITYADKFAPLVDERFTLLSLSEGVKNDSFDWIGVQTVKVFSRDLTTLNDYRASGSNRYGTPADLGNEVQEMTLTQDKAFTYVIDMKTEQDTMGAMEAGASLRENVDNLVIPAIDAYRFTTLVANAPKQGTHTKTSHIVTKAVTASNAYEEFLAIQEIIDNDKAPVGGRIAIVSPSYLNKIKLDENFVKRGDMATQLALNGIVGEIDGVPVVKVPSIYLPDSVDFIITNPIAMVAPVKLQEFKIHTDAPGISGSLVEARIRHDAFVLNKKADAIGVHKSQTIYIPVKPASGDNPSDKGWYEKSGNTYTLSTDTSVDASKTYYEQM